MLYFYNYNFIKYLNSVWTYFLILFFINIALLLTLSSTCLADGEIVSNLENKNQEIINNLPEDTVSDEDAFIPKEPIDFNKFLNIIKLIIGIIMCCWGFIVID